MGSASRAFQKDEGLAEAPKNLCQLGKMWGGKAQETASKLLRSEWETVTTDGMWWLLF